MNELESKLTGLKATVIIKGVIEHFTPKTQGEGLRMFSLYKNGLTLNLEESGKLIGHICVPNYYLKGDLKPVLNLLNKTFMN